MSRRGARFTRTLYCIDRPRRNHDPHCIGAVPSCLLARNHRAATSIWRNLLPSRSFPLATRCASWCSPSALGQVRRRSLHLGLRRLRPARSIPAPLTSATFARMSTHASSVARPSRQAFARLVSLHVTVTTSTRYSISTPNVALDVTAATIERRELVSWSRISLRRTRKMRRCIRTTLRESIAAAIVVTTQI